MEKTLPPVDESVVETAAVKKVSNDPLHGITLEEILNELVKTHGWEEMGGTVRIKCFNENPSIKSSLVFLRRTPWARSKVERMYLRHLRTLAKKAKKAAAVVNEKVLKGAT